MGNQLSNESGTKGPTGTFGRRGALGLNKSELDKRCTPSGLYPSCHWDDKAVRRLIGDGRLAARLPGTESRTSISDRECPICFLHYSQINETQCCKATICTECFLQVRPQKEKHSACPFCNNLKMYVAIAKRLDPSEIQDREEQDQRMIEHAIRARANGEDVSAPTERVSAGFGSSLENDEFVNRARSRTLPDGDRSLNMVNDIQLLRQLSLSSEDRIALEREMRAQHTHPLALQMEAEAEERRIANELEYYRNNPQRSREAALQRARLIGNDSFRNRISLMNPDNMRVMSSRSRRNFNDFADSTSLDDMVVLEAAILLSMEEEARANGVQEQLDRSSDTGGSRRWFRGSGRPLPSSATTDSGVTGAFSRSFTEDEQLAMAIALSMQEQNVTNGGKEARDLGDDKQARNAAGFPPESAPLTPSLDAASGVASLPIVSEDEDDSQEDEEELQKMSEFGRENAVFKYSDDDSCYFRTFDEPNQSSPAPRPEANLASGDATLVHPATTSDAYDGS